MTNEHFRGSIQFYQKQYGNCMTICREIGSVDLLITFTMNPEAEELRRMIPDGYSWADRPMEVCRLFVDKLKELECDLTQREVMGPVKGWFWSLEHQKRGLPHVHFAVILDWDRMRTKGCIFTKEDYMDQYISAEIPDLPNESDQSQSAQLQRELYRVIVSANIHKCDKRCLRDGRCKQRFPKKYADDNKYSDNAYPDYKRRAPAPNEQERKKDPLIYGNAHSYTDRYGQQHFITNTNVVPYSPFLSSKYKAQ
uniref:Helitron helicase-like domain-containing protein n=1 Tax=Meloidogyne enterolobii TaxID=390850 RepID=A0A6V7X0K8_MELEN|nr:unnamed protein product [Meloidogyne enterolobii]